MVEKSNVDDLEWFLLMLDYQLEETPYWVEDKNLLHEMQVWTRHVRTVVGGVLHNKQVSARNRQWNRRLARELGFLLVGVVLAWLLTFIEL